MTMHVFEQSGLGIAPFKVVSRSTDEESGQFWCDHCGTIIKHRNFISDTKGEVSIVGIDCLKKAGDQGLAEGARRIAREQKEKQREGARMKRVALRFESEREANGGETNVELAGRLLAQYEKVLADHIINNDSHVVLSSLTERGFEQSMSHYFYTAQPFSAMQLRYVKEIHTKKVSSSRKNSKSYKLAFDKCAREVDELQIIIEHTRRTADRLRARALQLSC